MELITSDNEDLKSTSNVKENKYLLSSYNNYLNKQPYHDLQKNILIEIEIIYYEKNTNNNINLEKTNYALEPRNEMKTSNMFK